MKSQNETPQSHPSGGQGEMPMIINVFFFLFSLFLCIFSFFSFFLFLLFFSLFYLFIFFSFFFRGGSTFLEGFSFSSGSGAYLVHKTNDSRSDHNGLQAYATISLRCSVGRVGVSGPSGFNVSFGFVHQRLRGLFGLKNIRPRMKRHGSKGICNPFRAWLLWLALGFGSVWVRRVCPKPADSALGFRVYDWV